MTRTQQTFSHAPVALSKLRYECYIASSRWAERKASYYARHEKKCRACGSTEDIHLHHHTYKRLGHEHDDDLTALCETCHDLVHTLHQHYKGKRSLTSVTREFIVANGGVFHPRRRRMTEGQKKRRKNTPPKYMTRKQASERLGVPVPKEKTSAGLVRKQTVIRWETDPPPWLLVARLVPASIISPLPGYRKYATYRGGGRPYSPEVQKLFDDHQPVG